MVIWFVDKKMQDGINRMVCPLHDQTIVIQWFFCGNQQTLSFLQLDQFVNAILRENADSGGMKLHMFFSGKFSFIVIYRVNARDGFGYTAYDMCPKIPSNGTTRYRDTVEGGFKRENGLLHNDAVNRDRDPLLKFGKYRRGGQVFGKLFFI